MTIHMNPDWLDALLDYGWLSSTVQCYLLSDTSLFDPTVDTTLADVPALDRVAGPATLADKSVSGGFFSASDPIFTLADGVVAAWFIAVMVGGSEATSLIIGSTDERAGGAPLLITGNGGTVELPFNALGLGRI